MATETISERTSPALFTGGADVDTPGVARGVVVCGLTSANGRDYPPEVLRRELKKYEGVQVYLDHLDSRGRSRGVREWFGELRDLRSRPDGRPEADLHYEPSHHFAEEFRGRARNFPRSLGLSHVIQADIKSAGGRQRVEAIQKVESVDLVASPATNASLFEGTAVATTVREVWEGVRAKLEAEKGKRLARVLYAEDVGLPMDAPMDAPPDDATGDDAIKSGVKAICASILDDDSLSAEQKIAKLRVALKMHEKLNGTGGKDGEPEETPAPESKKAPEWAGLVAECKAAGLAEPPASLIGTLLVVSSPEGRRVVIDGAKATAEAAKVRESAERPKSFARQGKVTEGAGAKGGDGANGSGSRLTWD